MFKYSTNQCENLNLPLQLLELNLLHIEDFPILQHLTLLAYPHQLSKIDLINACIVNGIIGSFLVIEHKKEKHIIIHNCK